MMLRTLILTAGLLLTTVQELPWQDGGRCIYGMIAGHCKPAPPPSDLTPGLIRTLPLPLAIECPSDPRCPEDTQAVIHHGAHDLTAREIIEMLADYDVVHRDQQPFFMPAFGVTNFESTPPTVWIFNTGDTPSRRATVIHEFLHIYYHQRSLDPPESFIRDEEERLYTKWFLP